ncbi:MAG TPA: hypothetical protein VD972_11400, partial [Hyalangium sp.]|nr:hypothetical protein [Hyalangium sp.]
MRHSGRRLPAAGLRAMGTRVLGLVGMLSMLACEGSGNAPAPQPQQHEGARTELTAHKVQLSAKEALQLEKSGANVQVLSDYGTYKLLQVDDKALAALPEGAELRDDYNDILLNAGTIDTASQHGRSLRGMKQQAGGKRFHLVQFSGPIKPEWHKELEATGVHIVTYIPNNAYLVYGGEEVLARLQQHVTTTAAIQWAGDYLDDYKLHPAIQTLETRTYAIQILQDEETNGPTLDLIRQLQSRDGVIQEGLGYLNVVAYLSRQDLYQIATRPDVLSIQPRPTRHKVDERQNMILAGQITGNQPTGPGYLAWLASKGFTQAQFTASGFGVDVTDSGVDNAVPAAPNHFGLYVGGNISNASR